jgi:hypothetical protein
MGFSAIRYPSRISTDLLAATRDHARQANTDAHHQVDLRFGDGGEDKGVLQPLRV